MKWWLYLVAVFLLVITAFAGSIWIFERAYAQKFLPGVMIGYLNVGGQTRDEVSSQLKSIEKNVAEKGFRFVSAEKEISISPIVISAADPDLAKPVLVFDWDRTLDSAFAFGRRGDLNQKIIEQLQAIFFGYQASVDYFLNHDELLAALKNGFSDLEKPPLNAQLVINGKDVEILGERSGYVLDYVQAIDQLNDNIKNLDFETINLDLSFREPQIKKEYTGSAVNSLETILDINSLKLTVDPYWWIINKERFIDWLEFQLIDGEVVVGFNKEKVLEFLASIAEAVNVEAQDAKFELTGERVTKFQASRDGKKLDIEQSYNIINQHIIVGNSEDIKLALEVAPAKVATGDINDFGIKELIGRGVSNFAGSPANRRHNIAVGAASLNGILITPDEEFSLLDALGEIDGEHGYKQELVIKGNRTIPEYGGGLCQIGTTAFRAALYSGLPIIERRNHSYRVVYYEPAGMDATIYNPAPDLKFINDTGYHILFTTKIEGDELIFEFYGTNDGREVTINPDPPTIFNISSPGEPRYIETDELKPGEKKIIEHSHKGADTHFKYTVIYPNGEVKEQDFNSHYVAWPEVWLVGREATTTEEIIGDENQNSPAL